MQIFVTSVFLLKVAKHLKSRGNNRSNAPEVLRKILLLSVSLGAFSCTHSVSGL